jgi:hypothetical protein
MLTIGSDFSHVGFARIRRNSQSGLCGRCYSLPASKRLSFSQTVFPAFDGGMRQWGFWYFGNWVPLFGSECQIPAHTETGENHT